MKMVEGVLLLYHRPRGPGAATVEEHIDALPRYSRLPVLALNTDGGAPSGLGDLAFRVVVLHYSLFPPGDYHLRGFREWLAARADGSYLVSFFQDEHHHTARRFAFIDEVGVDCVVTLVPEPWGERLYRSRTGVSQVAYNIPGYVSERLVAEAARFAKPDAQRSIDVGYRGRKLHAYMGRGGMEKYEIGVRFAERAAGSGLVLDIASGEGDRLYGDDWSRFTGDCRGTLGTESGVSIFDVEDRARERWEADPEADMSEFERPDAPEAQIPYRTVSPRHFEAAAFRTVQLMYEGAYSGVLEPGVHYIPLAKDFSNFDEALATFTDAGARRAIADRARTDLIDSGRWSYRRFAADFDATLASVGITAGDEAVVRDAAAVLARDERRRELRRTLKQARGWEFPGRTALARALGRR